MSQNSGDCLECRMTSGGGLVGGGIYVLCQARRFQSFSRHVITTIGSGLCLVGFLRIFNLSPFKRRPEPSDVRVNVDKTEEESEYIVGKLPRKFN